MTTMNDMDDDDQRPNHMAQFTKIHIWGPGGRDTGMTQRNLNINKIWPVPRGGQKLAIQGQASVHREAVERFYSFNWNAQCT